MICARIDFTNEMQYFGPTIFCVFAITFALSVSLETSPYLPPCKKDDRLYRKDGHCYPEGPGGPCPETLTFLFDIISTSRYSKQAGGSTAVGKCECTMKNSQRPCRHLPVLYSDAFNRCYEIYSQGPCVSGEWYTPTTYVEDNSTHFSKGVCTPNPCRSRDSKDAVPPGGASSNSSGNNRWYLHNDKCYKTGTRGHCLDPGHVAYFLENDPVPYCGDFHSEYGVCTQQEQALKGCGGRDELYHEESQKCYKEGSRKPCPEAMALNFKDEERTNRHFWKYGGNVEFGLCDCQLDKSGNACASKPYLFHVPAQRCFPAFSQGPCGPSEWFRPIRMKRNEYEYSREKPWTKPRYREGFCTKNDCLTLASRQNSTALAAKNDSSVFYFGIGDGQCYLTGTKGFCQEPGTVAAFVFDNHSPICAPPTVFTERCPTSGIGDWYLR